MSAARPVPIQFGTQLAQHLSGPLTQELAENLYLEPAPQGAKFKHILLGTPGLKLFGDAVATGPVRGLIRLANLIYAVVGDQLYTVDASGNRSLIGEIPGSADVSMSTNNTEVWIATGTRLFYAQGAILNELVVSGLDAPDITSYQDTFLLVTNKNSQKWYKSDALDGTVIDATSDFTLANTQPGNVTGIISDHREVLVFKDEAIEVYQNVGAADFPFRRVQIVERGCLAGKSIVKDQNKVYWLGEDRVVYSMSGYQPQPISTPPITRLIEARTSPHSAVGWTYQQRNHHFYVLSFDDLTLVYDISTGLWHRRKSEGIERWRANNHVYVPQWGKNIVGDYTNGNLYELDDETYAENGDVLLRRAIGAPVWNNGDRFIVDEFYLDIEGGVGLVSGQGSDPQAILDWTDNGGKTWSGRLQRSFGKIGQYKYQANWHRLGAHRTWSPRITISDPVPVRISGAYVRIDLLNV